MTNLVCSQTACPLLLDGTCLDGFDEPGDCPNSLASDHLVAEEAAPNAAGAGEPDPPTGEDEDEPYEPPRLGTTYIGGDQALSLTEANEVAASAPSTVVLVAGEFAAGKTTIVTELWAQFLDSAFADWDFAGSRTLTALDHRHGPARASSGRLTPTTSRTRDDDMRLLHLAVGMARRRVDLLLSDIKGEFFGDMIDGQAVSEAVPLAARADLCLVVIDGEQLRNHSARANAIWRTRLLIGALTEDGGLSPGTHLRIYVSKGDLLPAAVRLSLTPRLEDCKSFAMARGLDAEIRYITARPSAGTDDPEGLDELLEWLTLDRSETAADRPETGPPGDRFFWGEVRQ